MTMVRFDPFCEISSLRNTLDRLFEEPLSRNGFFEPIDVGSMPLDVFEEGNNVIVKASIPGFKPDEIHVQVRNDVASIWGESKSNDEKKDRNYHMREHRFSRIERSVMLPAPVLADKAEAVFENGVLTLTMPRTEAAKTKEIKVRAKA